jgi:hypothetical protein
MNSGIARQIQHMDFEATMIYAFDPIHEESTLF